MTRRLALALLLSLCLARASVAGAQPAGAFAAPPTFGATGLAAVVFLGGTTDQLEAAARASGANGAWVQHAGGAFELLIVGGPAFLRDAFAARFPGGFSVATAVTLTRPAGAAATPPPVPTPAPTPAPTPNVPRAFPGGVPGPSSNE